MEFLKTPKLMKDSKKSDRSDKPVTLTKSLSSLSILRSFSFKNIDLVTAVIVKNYKPTYLAQLLLLPNYHNIFDNIISFLNLPDVITLSETCRSMNFIINSDKCLIVFRKEISNALGFYFKNDSISVRKTISEIFGNHISPQSVMYRKKLINECGNELCIEHKIFDHVGANMCEENKIFQKIIKLKNNKKSLDRKEKLNQRIENELRIGNDYDDDDDQFCDPNDF